MSNTERPTRPEPEVCGRCEGSGAMYADGGAHDMSENAPTIRCGVCGGEGTVRDEEALDAYMDHLEQRNRELATAATDIQVENERFRKGWDDLRTRITELEVDLAASRKIRKYVAFALTGNEAADVQLAADEVAARITELEGLLRELVEAYESWILVVMAEHSELVSLAFVHGWHSTRVEEGQRLREKLDKVLDKHKAVDAAIREKLTTVGDSEVDQTMGQRVDL